MLIYDRFIARGYHDADYSGLAVYSFESSDYEYIKNKIHAMLLAGYFVEVKDTLEGFSYRIERRLYNGI